MINDIQRVLVSEAELDKIVTEIADKISEDYRGKRLVLVCILKGAVVFMGDLMKKITIPVEIDFMKVSSYGNATKTSGAVNILLDLHRKDLAETDILIVEDILDSGMTLSYLSKHIMAKGASSIKIATLLDKPERRKVDVYPDYKGFVVPDEFVVGYGLDYDEKYRNLPYVGVLKPEIYEK